MNLWVVTVVKDDLIGLTQTYESLTSQFFQPQWLVVTPQDNSTTWDYVSKLQADHRVQKLLIDPGEGIYSAMNLAIRNLESQDWVWFLNAGDRFANQESVKNVLDCIRRTKHRWLFGGHFLGSNQGDILGRIPAPAFFEAKNQLFAKKYVSHQAVVFEVGFLLELNGFDESYKIAADWDLLVRASKIDSGQRTSKELAIFYMGGASTASRQIGNIELLRARREHLGQQFLIKSSVWFVYRDIRNRLVRIAESTAPAFTNRVRKIRISTKPKVWLSFKSSQHD
jgi:hypothetical protein